MKRHSFIALILILSVPFLSFNDFIDYWTVKQNGKLIYDSNKDRKKQRLFLYTLPAKDIKLTDTLEVQYFTDTPCPNCIYNYFITESRDVNGKVSEGLGTYLKEQKSLGPRAYKIPLIDILNCGTKGTIKSICYYQNGSDLVQELCRISFQ